MVDTNVLVSGLINPHGPPGRIVDLIRSGVVELVVDDRIVAEYADVLRRPYLRRYFAPSDVEDVVEFLRHEGRNGESARWRSRERSWSGSSRRSRSKEGTVKEKLASKTGELFASPTAPRGRRGRLARQQEPRSLRYPRR